MEHGELLIDGHFFGGSCDNSVAKEPIESPYDQHVVGSAAVAGSAEIQSALASAAEAAPGWVRTDLEDRLSLVKQISDVVSEYAEDLAALMVDEIGKPIALARAEVQRTALTFELASQLREELSPKDIETKGDPRAADYKVQAIRRPVGPVLAITPYNWPFNLAAHKLGPALAAGCPVIIKGSPQAALSTALLARLIHRCGAPDGVIQYVNTSAALAEEMVVDPRIKAISFTGSDRVGWHIKSLAQRRKVALELGGDAASLVMPDADIDWAVKQSAASSMAYAGQICISLQRLIVHHSVYEEVREKLVQAVAAVPYGDPRDESTVCGPLISDDAADNILKAVEEAEQHGAKVLTGGSRFGRIIEPILIENVPPGVSLGCQEVFGPVCVLNRCIDLKDGLNQMNSSRYGLQGSIYTEDPEAIRQAITLDLGGLVINDAPSVRFDAMPYGGVKASGFGREGPAYALDDFTEWQSVVTRV